MALKPRYKRRIFWSIITIIALFILAIVIVPPMITLNNLKPKITQAIAEQTGVAAKINGDIHFSLLGRATIVVNDIDIAHGYIGSAMFTVPLTSIFNLESAPLTGDITIYDANISISSLIPTDFHHVIDIYNSKINFRNREIEIIDATMDGSHLVGVVRTKNHKYDIDFDNDVFYIHNQNDKLEISGQLFADGAVSGHISMETDNINRWFGFSQPHIDATVNISMNFEWDGGRGWKFTDIQMERISGNIEIKPNGEKIVQLRGHDIVYDLSFLMEPSRIFYQTSFDLDFTGKLKFGEHEFNHLIVRATGTRDALKINTVIADDISMTGGEIDEFGAHDITIKMPYNGKPAMCIFSGTPTDWKCSQYIYDDYVGAISVSPDEFDLLVYSQKPSPNRNDAIRDLLKFAPRGQIDFEFSDISGTYKIDGQHIIPTYRFANDKTLQWLDPNIEQIPQFMRSSIGDFHWQDNMMHFVPKSNRWQLYLTDKYFMISGKNAKDWFPNIDTRAFKNLEYTISGTYNGKNIANLEIIIADHKFYGSLNDDTITLHTDILNLDSFISQTYLDNYEELSFLTMPPITIPFELPINISLSADALIYNGITFKNFVYSSKKSSQTFSITDQNRGNLLATITRNDNKYDIFIQLNRFKTDGTLLSAQMPLNVRDTTITAEINMRTFGNIAHDLEYNMIGDMDLSFDDGYLVGIGIDDLFAAANQINSFNAEYALSYVLDGGESRIKKMRIIGKYKNGDFKTTAPIALQLRHTDATGTLEISDGAMYAQLNMILRGTSPAPQPIELQIMPNGTRQYSLSEIMTNFDATYMRDFIQTHKQF